MIAATGALAEVAGADFENKPKEDATCLAVFTYSKAFVALFLNIEGCRPRYCRIISRLTIQFGVESTNRCIKSYAGNNPRP